jgi:TatD DNase family protein
VDAPAPPSLVDTHCHIDVADFDADRAQVLARCRQLGIEHIIVPGVAAASWAGLAAVIRGERMLHASYGLHPVYIEEHRAADLDALKNYIAAERPLAVGEIGLDYYLEHLDRGRQKEFFVAQLEIARQAGLPVILHARKAHHDILACLKQARVCGGVCHAFNGSLQQAHEYLDLGFKLGFGGMLTFERSSNLRRLAAELPLEAIVLETDAPDMSGALHVGQRNSPEYLPEVLAALAAIRQAPAEEIAAQTTKNAAMLFKLA